MGITPSLPLVSNSAICVYPASGVIVRDTAQHSTTTVPRISAFAVVVVRPSDGCGAPDPVLPPPSTSRGVVVSTTDAVPMANDTGPAFDWLNVTVQVPDEEVAMAQ